MLMESSTTVAVAATEPPETSHDELSAIVTDARLTRLEPAGNGGFLTDFYYSEQLSDLMGDAPLCDNCGQITIRSGSCYRCLFCGDSMGCS